MWTPLEPWQLSRLERLAELDPERVESALNALWKSFPDLLGDLAVLAVEEGTLSAEAAAEKLGISELEVRSRVGALRKAQPILKAVVLDERSAVARIVNQVPVWEVIREYRKLGSAERLEQAFPGLSEAELAAALRYAQENPAEIERQISEYEAIVARRRGESFGYDRQAS